MAVALKVNGVACRDIDTRNGVSKLSIETYPGGPTTSPAPIFYFTYEDHDTAIEDYSESGTDHDGTGTSTERSDTAKLGSKSLEIDTGDILTITHHADLDWDYDDPWTVSVWIKTAATGYRGIYSKREGASGYKGPAIFLNSGKVEAYLVSNFAVADSRIYRVTTTTVHDDNWQHIVITYDGSGNDTGMLCYINGSLDTTFATGGGKTTVGTNATTTAVNPRVGADTLGTTMGINGLIDETAAWGVALTANQVSVLYNSGSPAAIASGL